MQAGLRTLVSFQRDENALKLTGDGPISINKLKATALCTSNRCIVLYISIKVFFKDINAQFAAFTCTKIKCHSITEREFGTSCLRWLMEPVS